jgi:hypothetical protein
MIPAEYKLRMFGLLSADQQNRYNMLRPGADPGPSKQEVLAFIKMPLDEQAQMLASMSDDPL